MKRFFLVAAIFIIDQSGFAQPKDSTKLLRQTSPAIYQVDMQTTLGEMVIEVYKSWSPLAADRFYQLVKSGFYNNSRLFRSNQKYLQFGVANDSAINAFWDRHTIKDEPVLQKNVAGTISFAMGGPDTRTASVYFNKIDNPKLDTIHAAKGFPPFGKIINGFDIIGKFENKYPDSVVFKHMDIIANKGNQYADSIMPGLASIISMKIKTNTKTLAVKNKTVKRTRN